MQELGDPQTVGGSLWKKKFKVKSAVELIGCR